jgi:hypothetical protein
VISAVSGYAGGARDTAHYEMTSSGDQLWPSSPALTLRFAIDDLKAFALEAALTKGNRPSSKQLGDWLWDSTALGVGLQALRRECLAGDDERLKAVAAEGGCGVLRPGTARAGRLILARFQPVASVRARDDRRKGAASHRCGDAGWRREWSAIPPVPSLCR